MGSNDDEDTNTHPVANTHIEHLTRKAVIDRLIVGDILDETGHRPYDIEHDIAAEAYVLARHDQRTLDHVVTADDLDRRHVIDRLLYRRVIRPGDPYDIDRDVLVSAYRLGIRDGSNSR